jgi:hypothetical protein
MGFPKIMGSTRVAKFLIFSHNETHIAPIKKARTPTPTPRSQQSSCGRPGLFGDRRTGEYAGDFFAARVHVEMKNPRRDTALPR